MSKSRDRLPTRLAAISLAGILLMVGFIAWIRGGAFAVMPALIWTMMIILVILMAILVVAFVLEEKHARNWHELSSTIEGITMTEQGFTLNSLGRPGDTQIGINLDNGHLITMLARDFIPGTIKVTYETRFRTLQEYQNVRLVDGRGEAVRVDTEVSPTLAMK